MILNYGFEHLTIRLQAAETLLQGRHRDLACLGDFGYRDRKNITAFNNKRYTARCEARRHILLRQAGLFCLLCHTPTKSMQVFHLISGDREAAQRELNVFDGMRAGLAGLIHLGHVKKSLLACQGHHFLHLFESLRESRRRETEDVGDFLGLARRARSLEAHVETGRKKGIAAEPLTSADVLQRGIELLGIFHDRLIDARIEGDKRETLTGLEERALFVRNRVPGMIFSNTVHGLCRAVPVQNDGAKGCFGQAGILWCADTGGITTAVLLGKVAVLGGVIERTTDNVTTLATGDEIGGIEAVGVKTVRATVCVSGRRWRLVLPAFKGFFYRWKGTNLE